MLVIDRHANENRRCLGKKSFGQLKLDVAELRSSFLHLHATPVAFVNNIADTISMFSRNRFFVPITLCALLFFPLSVFAQESKQSNGLYYASFRGQSSPSKELLATLERQALWEQESGNHNPTGLRLRFVKIDDQKTPEGVVAARYRIFAEGAAENKVFAFGSWTIGKTFTTESRDIYVNGQGLLMNHKPLPEQEMSLQDPDELVVQPVTVTAEPMRYALTPRDGQTQIFGTVVPHPLVADEQGCRLEVLLGEPAAKSVLFVIDGFPVKSRISLVLESEGKSMSQVVVTNQDGHAVLAAFPYITGKTQGSIKASAEGPNCLPSVVLPWGQADQPPAAAPAAPSAPAAATAPAH